jgi:basic amino acid/polyamine antiporter, APA family
MTRLARKLGGIDYFTLSFGTMIGAGWLVVMDDWLARGGPAGAALGFALGTLLLVPVAYTYSRLVALIPDAASEVAYTTRAFGRRNVAFATGWMMTLAYIIVCPWEALAIGKIAGYLVPRLNRWPLYDVGGRPVYAPHLAVGLALTLGLLVLNYRGVQISARAQNIATALFGVLFAAFAVFGFARGSAANLRPAFSHTPLVSLLLTMQIVPYFMTGFEAVPKCAEESRPGFERERFGRAIFAALFTGGVFYAVVIAVVSFVAPWRELLNVRFATAVAFTRVGAGHVLVDLIFIAALVSMVKVANGNYVAGSRLLYGMARAGLVSPVFANVHERRQTPWVAIIGVAVFTVATALLGDHLLISVTEVGALASALGWFAASTAFLKLARTPRDRMVAALGMIVSFAFVLLKLLPQVPGHFSSGEYTALAAWVAVGLVLRATAGTRIHHRGPERQRDPVIR